MRLQIEVRRGRGSLHAIADSDSRKTGVPISDWVQNQIASAAAVPTKRIAKAFCGNELIPRPFRFLKMYYWDRFLQLNCGSSACAGGRSAADEMYDLQPVAVFQWRLRPLLARHNFKVEFDGHAIRLHPQVFDERV